MRHAERQREENQRPGALWPDISPANTTPDGCVQFTPVV